MSKFTKELIDKLADNLLIGLTNEENDLVLSEFDIIEKNMELINKIADIEKVEPMTHTLDNFEYVLRNDEIEESIPIEKLLQNCDNYEGREIAVPKVVGGVES